MTLCTQEIFDSDTAEHVLTVFRDDGLYRHIKVAKPGLIDMHFEIVTWPGYLAYVGDMGAYTFQRTADMFEFFRSNARINPSYWSEKVEAMDKHVGLEKFCLANFKNRALQDVADFIESQSLSPKEKSFLINSTSCFVEELPDCEYEALNLVTEYECEIESEADSEDDLITFKFSFHDEYSGCTEFTFHFLWCCYAIVRAIALYDASKLKEAA